MRRTSKTSSLNSRETNSDTDPRSFRPRTRVACSSLLHCPPLYLTRIEKLKAPSQPFLSRKALGDLLIACIFASRGRNTDLQESSVIPQIERGPFENEP